MHLEGDDTALWGLCGFVGDVCGEFAVDVLLDAISLGDDFVFVPIVFVDSGLDFFAVTGGAGDFDFGFLGLIALFDDDLFTAFGEDTTAFFLIENATPFFTIFEVGLIAADDEFCGIDDFAAVLDAAVGVFFVVTRGHFEFEGEGEIGGFAAFPSEEGVVRNGVFLGGFCGDGAIDDGPEFRIAFPTGEVFAVEELGFASECGEGQKCCEEDVFHDIFLGWN